MIRFKQIFYKTVHTLASRLEELNNWLTKRGFTNDMLTKEIGKGNLTERKNLLEKQPKERSKHQTLWVATTKSLKYINLDTSCETYIIYYGTCKIKLNCYMLL